MLHKEKMRGRVVVKLAMVLVLLFVIAGLFFALHRARQHLAQAPAYHPRLVPVTFARVRQGSLGMSRHYLARVESECKASLTPRITARIVKVLVDEGDRVKKGALLVRLDDREEQNQIRSIQAELQAQEAKIASLRSDLAAAQSDLTYLEREFSRAKRLFAGKAISRSALDAAQNRYEVAKSRIQGLQDSISSLEQGLKSLVSQLHQARIRLSYTRMRAPYDGVVERRYQDPGDLAQPSHPVLQIFVPDKLRLSFSLVQEDLAGVQTGDQVRILWPEERGQAAQGLGTKGLPPVARISRIFPALEVGKTVRAEVDLGKLFLVKPGTFVPVEVVQGLSKGLIVPSSALLKGSLGSDVVYLIRKGHLQRVEVQVRVLSNGQALIQGPVQAGDKVAVGKYLQWVRLAPGKAVEEGL